MTSSWLTVREAAQLARISVSSLYGAIERNEVRHSRVNGKRSIRVEATAIDEWLRSFERPAQFRTTASN